MSGCRLGDLWTLDIGTGDFWGFYGVFRGFGVWGGTGTWQNWGFRGTFYHNLKTFSFYFWGFLGAVSSRFGVVPSHFGVVPSQFGAVLSHFGCL